MQGTSRHANDLTRHTRLLSGRVHPGLAQSVADHLDINLSPVSFTDFANSEINCRIDESVRGCDVFVIQSHAGDVSSAIMEQLLLIDAAKRASARTVTAVCPYMGYARQDRKSRDREPIASRLIIDMMETAGVDRIMSVDLHSGQIQGFFDGPFDHLVAMPVFYEYVKAHFKDNFIIVSPDAGRVKLNEKYSRALGCDMAIIHKQRLTEIHNQSEAKQLIGDVTGKDCLLIDDMIDTAGTICAAADLLREQGAKDIYGIATHGILSDPACKRISESAFKSVIVTDTLPVDTALCSKLKVIPVSGLIARAIDAIVSNQSLSAIFSGENQF